MKHSVQLFLAILCCIAINRSVAMELEKPTKQEKIITEITCIKNPQYAQYLHNGNIAITGEDGCSIVDPKTNTEISKISTAKNQRITTHSNQKLFALAHENQIEIYDTEQNNFIWQKTVEGSYKHSPNPYDKVKQICFNPHDTTIFIIRANFRNYVEGNSECYHPMDYRITEYNYATDQDGINNSNFGYNTRTPLIALSPTQKEICIIHPHCVTFHQTNSELSEQNSHAGHSYGKYYKDFCQYSSDGAYIVQGGCKNNIHIINSQNPQQHDWFKHTCADTHRYEDFKNIQFYSNSVLAIASLLRIYNHKNLLESSPTESHTLLFYFDIHTKKLIHVSQPLDISKTCDFSFSHDKTQVIIALKDTCVILPVPFEVIYKDITEEQFTYLLFALNNIKLESDTAQLLPEVNRLIAQTVLALHKRD